MFKSFKCHLKGHLYVDSRSQPGTQVCVRCKHRKPFESFTEPPQVGPDTSNRVVTGNI